MKKTNLFILLIVLYSGYSFGQWSTYSISGLSDYIFSMAWPNSTTGFICGGYSGSSSFIYKTTNSGSGWTRVYTGSITELNSIHFPSSNVGYCAGGSRLLKSSDGGNNWTDIYTNITNSGYNLAGEAWGLYFVSELEGYVGQNGGKVLKTTDGGTSWTLALDAYNQVLEVYFISSTTGFVGARSGIFKTTDSGANWTWVWKSDGWGGSGDYFWGLSFPTSSVGYCSSTGKVLKTTDGGNSWTAQTINYNHYPSIYFSDANNGVVVGLNGYIFRTTNGGTNWVYEGGATSESLYEVRFPSANNGQICGSGGALLNSTTPLPVELISFTGNVSGSNVKLNWQTATEVNNYGFSVERRTKNEEWIKVGFVNGFGNSNSTKNYSYIDYPSGGNNFSYRLKQIDFDGKFEYSNIIELSLDIPQQFNLEQNHPNPFNPITTINYSIPFNGNAKLVVYDVLGREIAKLFDEFKYAGNHHVEFNASQLNSGIYFYKLIYNAQSLTKRMILIK